MIQKKGKGFTLIELLVVIAIIGILASVFLIIVMSNLTKFNDGRVVSAMDQIRTKASVLYQNSQDYLNIACSDTEFPDCVCNDAEVQTLCNDILINSDQNLALNLNSDKSGFCAVAHLEGDNQYFCVDGNLIAKKYVVSPEDNTCATACEAANDCKCE